jgi:hypothetical protein
MVDIAGSPFFLPESQHNADRLRSPNAHESIEGITGQLEDETALNTLVPPRDNIYRVYNGEMLMISPRALRCDKPHVLPLPKLSRS